MTWRVIWFHDVSCQNSGVFVLGSSLNCLKKHCWFVVSIMFDSPSLLIWHSWPHLFLGWVDVPGWNFIASLTCLGGVWRPETDLPDRIAFGPWVSHAIPRLTWNILKPTGNPQRYQQVELGRRCSWWNLAVLVGQPYSIGVAAQFPVVVPVPLALPNGNSDVQVLTICGRLGTGHPVKTIRCSLQHLGCACACGWPGLLDMLWAVASSNLSLGKTRTQPLQEWVWRVCIPPSFPM